MGVMPTNVTFSTLRRAGLLSILLASASATAAYAVTVPGQVDPSQIEKHFDRQQQSPLPSSNLQVSPPSTTANPKLQAELAKKRFVLKGVAIDGNTVFKQEDLKF